MHYLNEDKNNIVRFDAATQSADAVIAQVKETLLCCDLSKFSNLETRQLTPAALDELRSFITARLDADMQSYADDLIVHLGFAVPNHQPQNTKKNLLEAFTLTEDDISTGADKARHDPHVKEAIILHALELETDIPKASKSYIHEICNRDYSNMTAEQSTFVISAKPPTDGCKEARQYRFDPTAHEGKVRVYKAGDGNILLFAYVPDGMNVSKSLLASVAGVSANQIEKASQTILDDIGIGRARLNFHSPELAEKAGHNVKVVTAEALHGLRGAHSNNLGHAMLSIHCPSHAQEIQSAKRVAHDSADVSYISDAIAKKKSPYKTEVEKITVGVLRTDDGNLNREWIGQEISRQLKRHVDMRDVRIEINEIALDGEQYAGMPKDKGKRKDWLEKTFGESLPRAANENYYFMSACSLLSSHGIEKIVGELYPQAYVNSLPMVLSERAGMYPNQTIAVLCRDYVNPTENKESAFRNVSGNFLFISDVAGEQAGDDQLRKGMKRLTDAFKKKKTVPKGKPLQDVLAAIPYEILNDVDRIYGFSTSFANYANTAADFKEQRMEYETTHNVAIRTLLELSCKSLANFIAETLQAKEIDSHESGCHSL